MSRIFGSLALASGFWGLAGSIDPATVDFDKVEIWPLSGGVRDGVSVEISAEGVKQGEMAAIEFLAADYTKVFGFEIDAANSLIKRSGATGLLETRGGWPFEAGAAGPMTLKFLMTPSSWRITIDGARVPWFDFAHQVTESAVYVAVYKGLEDAEVFDERPACATKCDVTECLNAEGITNCPAEDGCYARIPDSANPRVAVCSEHQTTGDDDQHCCDGVELSDMTFEEGVVGTWAQVHQDADHVKEACAAFGSPSGEKCGTAAGRKVEIRGINTTTGMYTAWVPQLYALARDMQTIEIPPDVLSTSAQASKTIDGTGIATKFRVQNSHALITSVEQEAEDAGIQEYYFLNMFMINLEATGDWWLSYSDRVWPSVRGLPTLDLYLVDEEVGHTACRDDVAFFDSRGSSCTNYTEGAWCEDHGIATDAFRAANEGVRNLDELANSSSWHAIYMCCRCGGGFHEPPPTAQAVLLQ